MSERLDAKIIGRTLRFSATALAIATLAAAAYCEHVSRTPSTPAAPLAPLATPTLSASPSQRATELNRIDNIEDLVKEGWSVFRSSGTKAGAPAIASAMRCSEPHPVSAYDQTMLGPHIDMAIKAINLGPEPLALVIQHGLTKRIVASTTSGIEIAIDQHYILGSLTGQEPRSIDPFSVYNIFVSRVEGTGSDLRLIGNPLVGVNASVTCTTPALARTSLTNFR